MSKKLENIKEYRKLKAIRKGLEYKYCLELDQDKKREIKKRMYELKLHIKILENSLNILNEIERAVIYLAYFKENFIFSSWQQVAVELHLDKSCVYKHRNTAVIKIDSYLKDIDVDSKGYYSLKQRLDFNRKRFKVKKVDIRQVSFDSLKEQINMTF